MKNIVDVKMDTVTKYSPCGGIHNDDIKQNRLRIPKFYYTSRDKLMPSLEFDAIIKYIIVANVKNNY